ncbi:unnamed protein product, partial [Sphacelaria rigidula]
RQEKLVKKALGSSSIDALLVCSGTPMVAEPVVHPKAPPLSQDEQRERNKALRVAKKELKKLGKAGKAEIKRMEEEEMRPKIALLSPEEVGLMDEFYDEKRPCFHWSYHSQYLQEMLEKLFDWAGAHMYSERGLPKRRREVVLLCSGTGSAVRTVVHDRRTGLSLTQICVGNIADATKPCTWSTTTGAVGDRIEYTHYPAMTSSSYISDDSTKLIQRGGGRARGTSSGGGEGSPSYGVVTVLSEPLVCQVEAQLVQPRDGAAAPKISTKPGHDQNHLNHDNATAVVETPEGGQSQRGTVMDLDPRTVSAVLGPVVGRAEIVRQEGGARESCRVAVMLEVDGDATVTCLMRDVVTSEAFQEKRRMKGRRPRAFWMQGLRAARRYAIEFEGISNCEDRAGVWTTPDSSQPDLNVVVISHDQPGELPATRGEQNLWRSLAGRLSSPWQGIEAIIHVGGQVDLSNAFEDGRAFLESLQTGIEQGLVSIEDESLAMDELKERFRDEYRKLWNQPSTRKVLSSCQHVMMWGQNECRAGYGRQGHAAVKDWAGKRLLRVAKEVFREYQRQLWDPRWGASFTVGEHEGFFTSFRWGTVGVISLDTLELSLLHDGLAVKAHDSARGLDVKKRMQERGRNEEDLMLGEAQWEMLDGVLANQDKLATLLVVTEVPVAWHDTETFFANKKVATINAPANLEDFWSGRPIQQRALLKRLLEWKAEVQGREVTLLAGAWGAGGCIASETRLECKMPPALPSSNSETSQEIRAPKRDSEGAALEEDGLKEPKSRLVGITQVTCGPITAEPLDLSISDARPATRGKLLIPLTEAQSQEKRLRPKNSNSSSIAVGGAMGENQGSGRDVVSNAQDEDPVEFVHITRPGRNYVVLQV